MSNHIDPAAVLAEVRALAQRAGVRGSFTVVQDGRGNVTAEPIVYRSARSQRSAASTATPTRAGSTAVTSDELEALREDARRLFAKHAGDLRRLYADPSLNIGGVIEVHRSEIDSHARSKGHEGRTWATVMREPDGTFTVRLAADVPLEQRTRCLLHEIGHVRAIQMHRDWSEAAAHAWESAWWQADAEAYSD